MDLKVYTTKWCRDCKVAKQFLAEHNIPYTEIDMETTPGAADELHANVGKHAVPQFVIDAPGGGGKIPVNPETVLSHNADRLVLRNYEGRVFEYPEVPAAAPARRAGKIEEYEFI